MNPLDYFLKNPVSWGAALVLIALVVVSLVRYLLRAEDFKKGIWGKKFVDQKLRAFSRQKGFVHLQDVTVRDGDESISLDHVLIGHFGVLLLQSIQGAGSFWGDGKQDTWACTDDGHKILFRNPLDELDEKSALLRRALSKRKCYNVPIENCVVIATLGKAPSMFLSNMEGRSKVLLDSQLSAYLRQDHFLKDNKVEPQTVAAVFEQK